MRVGHISVAESGTSCWESNGRCPLDALAGYPVGTDAYRAPGFVLGLLRNFVGAAGFPPLLCAAGAANALRYTVEYDPGHFCEENLWQSHVHMCIFAPAGMVHPAPVLICCEANTGYGTAVNMSEAHADRLYGPKR